MKRDKRNLKKFETIRPECHKCERDLYEYIQQKGAKVWKKGAGRGAIAPYGLRVKYYCNDCKKDLFEGVKLR